MYKCHRCGSTDVETHLWVKINDIRQTDFETQEIPKDSIVSNFCNNCEDNCLLDYEDENK